jgi:hypothetical protein
VLPAPPPDSAGNTRPSLRWGGLIPVSTPRSIPAAKPRYGNAFSQNENCCLGGDFTLLHVAGARSPAPTPGPSGLSHPRPVRLDAIFASGRASPARLGFGGAVAGWLAPAIDLLPPCGFHQLNSRHPEPQLFTPAAFPALHRMSAPDHCCTRGARPRSKWAGRIKGQWLSA